MRMQSVIRSNPYQMSEVVLSLTETEIKYITNMMFHGLENAISSKSETTETIEKYKKLYGNMMIVSHTVQYGMPQQDALIAEVATDKYFIQNLNQYIKYLDEEVPHGED